jgi:hypothetical protein
MPKPSKKPTQKAVQAARERIIEELIEDRVATVMNASDDGAGLKSVFRAGHAGYSNFTDDQLLEEVERLEDNPDENEAAEVQAAVTLLKQASA